MRTQYNKMAESAELKVEWALTLAWQIAFHIVKFEFQMMAMYLPDSTDSLNVIIKVYNKNCKAEATKLSVTLLASY